METEPNPQDAVTGLRIGALAERVGTTETLLRVWERRYGLLSPTRTAGGYRMYGPDDERRARAMVKARERGVPAAQAAASILAAERAGGPGDGTGPEATAAEATPASVWVAELLRTTEVFDDAGTHAVLDRAFADRSAETVVRDVLMPFLVQVGQGWVDGTVTIEQEHFASEVLKGRLSALATGFSATTGPLAVLACPPGERHDLALKAFEVVLLRAGWRVRYLGADTPITSLATACEQIDPDLVVVAAVDPRHVEACTDDLRRLGADQRLALAGPGATAAAADAAGALLLGQDPVAAARTVTDLVARGKGTLS